MSLGSVAEDQAPVTTSEPALQSHKTTDLKDESSATPAVVALASKPPVVSTNGRWRIAPGGLAPIVRRALDDRGGAWVSWNGGGAPVPQRVDDASFQILTFNLNRSDAEGFYAGYANRTLWPLFHDMVVSPVFDPSWWTAYRNANAAFASAAGVALSRVDSTATLWVHDYHLMLLPSMLRERGSTNPISFFLHTPFPSPAVFARLPERTALIEGLSGADLVGFHTEGDRQRFLAAWSSYGSGPPPNTTAVPASIDAAQLATDAQSPKIARRARELRQRLGDRILLFSAERLDYTKGIPERLQAIEVLLRRRPDLRRRLAYVQVAHPSRERVPEYRQLRERVEREVGRLNGIFTTPGYDVPIRYLHRAISYEQLLTYFVAADVGMVTPLRDGMNLVAKEFVTAQAAAKGMGALVLSEFAGAASELTDAVLCNPYDANGTADAIEQAIEMSEAERRDRLSVMAVHIENNDIECWADHLLRTAERSAECRGI